jgi:hypothetical protein
MSSKEITFDPNYLYIDQEKFFPILQEMEDTSDSLDSVNGVVIYINCAQDADFQWEDAILLAEKAVELGKWILWDLDFGLHEKRIFLEDSAAFFSNEIAMNEFIKTLWRPFQEQTIGACLFRGGVEFAKYFVWTEQHEQLYLEKSRESAFLNSDPDLEEMGRKLFAADVFSDYLHRLSSFLPENLIPFCLFDVSSVESDAALSLLLSRERFQHLLLALKHSRLPLGSLKWEEGKCFGGWIGRGAPYFSAVHDVTLGVCVPLEEKMTKDLLKQLDDVFVELDRLQVAYRVISELYLNESWDGIDEIIVFGSAVSTQGLRKLKGFLAAGGKVIHANEPLGLSSEISMAELSSR